MNRFKVTINPYQHINTLSVDGRPLSPYSELSNYLKREFLTWADKLQAGVENEINDYYELVVVASEFEKLFLKDLLGPSSFCKNIIFENFNWNDSVDDRFDTANRLNQSYKQDVTVERLPINCEYNMILSEEWFCKSSPEDATIIILSDDNKIDFELYKSAQIIIVISDDKNQIVCRENSRYIWYTTLTMAQRIVEAAADYFVKIPFIIESVKLLNSIDVITEEDANNIELLVSIDPIIGIDEIKQIELGAQKIIQIHTFPQKCEAPKIFFESSDPSVISINENKAIALKKGEAIINVYKGDEIIPFLQEEVYVFEDRSIFKIELNRPNPEMGIGQAQQISITYEPVNAEDADCIVWTSSDPSIIKVDDQGLARSIGRGKATITAATRKTRDSVIIEVLPNIEKLIPSENQIFVAINTAYEIDVAIEPKKVINSGYTWSSSNVNIAIVEKSVDGRTWVKGKQLGRCKVICKADEGDCYCSIDVNIITLEEHNRREQMRRAEERKKIRREKYEKATRWI